MSEDAPGRLLGLDLGTRRIGVAVTDSARRVATGVATIERDHEPERDHAEVAALVEQYAAVGVVVGVPYRLDGGEGPAARAARAEAADLARRLAVPVFTADERLTTVVAVGALRAAGRPARRQRGVVDREAAAAILQGFVDRERR
jgi:putative Holliday junction resolvase